MNFKLPRIWDYYYWGILIGVGAVFFAASAVIVMAVKGDALIAGISCLIDIPFIAASIYVVKKIRELKAEA